MCFDNLSNIPRETGNVSNKIKKAWSHNAPVFKHHHNGNVQVMTMLVA